MRKKKKYIIFGGEKNEVALNFLKWKKKKKKAYTRILSSDFSVRQQDF